MIYIFGIIFLFVILWFGFGELFSEIKNKTLFKKQDFIWGGKVGYEMGCSGEKGSSWGCGTYFLITIIVGIVIYIGVKP
ncbi:MAG: hypothetical protein PWQ55_368 [Chloroflexota bacterium]|nr:hypothetical protein [Chloroflexota bacterium]